MPQDKCVLLNLRKTGKEEGKGRREKIGERRRKERKEVKKKRKDEQRRERGRQFL